MNIGITGSTGSLGIVVKKKFKKLKLISYRGDIIDRNRIFKWFDKYNLKAIIHLAAIVPIKKVNKNKIKAREVNLNGTKNIVDACIKYNIRWMFYSSTSHVYKPSKKKISENFTKKPISYYGKTKLEAEDYIIKKFKKSKIPYCIGRIFSTTSKNQKQSYLVPDLKKKIRYSNSKIVLKNLNHYRDFISMEDIAKIMLHLYKLRYKGIVNIASGQNTYLKDIALIILKKYKKNNYEFIDNPIATSLGGDITKLKKIKNFKIVKSIERLIF